MRRLLAALFVVSVVFAVTNICPGSTDAGRVVGWGTNRPPPAGHNFGAIAAGYYHSLALKSDGTIVGWGNNDYGQADPCDGNDFTAIAAGDFHSLALKSNGSLVGWGWNNYGQADPCDGNDFVAIAAGSYHSLALKSDDTIVGWGRDNYGQATPPVGNDFVAIAAGANHSLALKSNGTIVGWGRNNYGQADPCDGNDFVAIAAGYYHSLALKSDGTIVAWGNNDFGQADPCDGNNFAAIAAGYWHSLALKKDGTIVGWGYNDDGRATPPDGNDFVAIATGNDYSLALKSDGSIVTWGYHNFGQADPCAGNDFVAIAAGYYHSLALKSDGSIVGWGNNDYGQADPCDGNDFKAIAAGDYHSLALKSDGTIVAWGYNNYGQATPPDGNDFDAIAAGGYHSLALTSDGIIVGWGYNNYGQADPCDGNDFADIAAGGYHSLALKSDGTIVGWGYNGYGQVTTPGGNDFVAIAAGEYHSLALKSDGTIVGWGRNNYGQADPCNGNDFVAIAAGRYHSLALKSDGSIVGWGWNDYSQATPPVGYGFVAIPAGGMYHSLAIAQNIYTLTINTVGNGSVTKDPNQVTYRYGEAVELTAAPDTGWSFDSWSGGLSGNTNPDTITIDGNETVTATFTKNEYSLTINTAGNGSVTKDPNQATYHYGDTVELTAIPDAGWSFDSWSGGLSGSTNPGTITMDGNKTVTATFTQNEYTLTVNTLGNGSVTKDPNQATYHYGDAVGLTAIPDSGWSFDSWSGGLTGNTNPGTITIDGNETVTATFNMNVVGGLSVAKCLVKAGKADSSDMILILGQMNATVADFNDANNILQVTVNSNDMLNPCVLTFPINATTFKRGRYSYSGRNETKTSFKFNTKTRKFSFMAKNVDLSGLGCPLIIEIRVGDYTGADDVNEAIVNGPRRPIPIKLMMGVKNSLRVDRYKVRRGKKPNTGQLSVKGGFAVDDPNVNLAAVDFVVGLASQTWTIPAGSFTEKNGVFTCKNIELSGIANARLNLNTCVFTLTIKNTAITAGPGAANFSVEFAGFDESVQIVLP